MYLTSIALGLVSCFTLTSSASAAADAQAKPVLSVDEDQGFFVLNHSHPLSPKQGYVILDAGATTSAFHLCVRRLVSTARVAACPRVNV